MTVKTTIFAVMFALIEMNAEVATDNTNPSPTTLVGTEILPQFKAKVKMEANRIPT